MGGRSEEMIFVLKKKDGSIGQFFPCGKVSWEYRIVSEKRPWEEHDLFSAPDNLPENC